MEQDLRFVDCHQTAVEGAMCQDILVRDASGIIGRVQGFVVDAAARQLKYLVVQTTGLLKRTKLLPLTLARIDLTAGEIHLLDENDTRHAEAFQPDLFPTF